MTATTRPTVMATHGMVATEHYLSAAAGLDILLAGGNAVDAACAAILVEGVVNPHMHTLGGEVPMLVYHARERAVRVVNGNTVAPRAATPEAFRARGHEAIPHAGVIAAGPPAALGAICTALERFGTRPLGEVAAAAIRLADEGFPLHAHLRGPGGLMAIGDCADHFRDAWPTSAGLYLPGGRLPAVGARLRNPELAAVLRRLAAAEADGARRSRAAGLDAARACFYRGPVAERLIAFVERERGLLAAEDLAAFETRIEEPVTLAYRGHEVYKCGPWSQGPVFLQTLALLAGDDLAGLGHNGADYLHLLVEALKLAFADREAYYGDPRFVDVPLTDLLAPAYAAVRRPLIDPDRAARALRPGDARRRAPHHPSPPAAVRAWGPGTVHVAVVDAERNMVAATPSGGWISGSPVVEGLGFALSTRLQTFYLDADHPNVVAPGKQPRTTLTPSLVLRAGAPAMVFGTQGGDLQDQWSLQFFLNRVVFGMDVQEAIEAPRVSSWHAPGSFFPHAASPGLLYAEDRIPADVRAELQRRGHEVVAADQWSEGDVVAVAVDPGADALHGGADPRGHRSRRMPSYVIGW